MTLLLVAIGSYLAGFFTYDFMMKFRIQLGEKQKKLDKEGTGVQPRKTWPGIREFVILGAFGAAVVACALWKALS